MNTLIALLIKALIIVESGGNLNAIGDNGTAWGCLQIRQCCLDDVNRIYKTNYTKKDCFSKEKSIDIAKKYLTFYGKQYQRKTGREPNARILALIWNAGPYKPSKMAKTKKYWAKTVAVLKGMK